MTPRFRHTLWALALGLVAAGPAARDAKADPIQFGSVGTVDTPTGGTPNLVAFNGTTGTFDPSKPGSINLGSFVVSPTSENDSAPTVNYHNDPLQLILFSGPSQSVKIDGVINGSVGPDVTAPLTATFTGISQFGSSPLPFNFSLPLNTPFSISQSTGTGAATTILTAAASPVPEPASVAVFGLALGGLGLWRRRAGR